MLKFLKGKESSKSILKSTESLYQHPPGEDVSNIFERWYSQNKSLVMRQTPVWAQSMACIFFAIGSIAIVGSYVIKIDEVISVSGSLKSVGGNKEIKSLVSGKLGKVYVKDGDLISKNQILASFDTTEVAAEFKAVNNLLQYTKESFNKSISLFSLKKKALERKRELLKVKINTQEEILSALRGLMSVGAYQRLQYLSEKDEMLRLQQEFDAIDEESTALDLNLEKTKLDSSERIEQLDARSSQLEFILDNSVISATSSGILFESNLQEKGVYTQGELLASIVPQDGLYAEVLVSDKDIGFVEPDQSAEVKIDAFPFTTYGSIKGKITSISADAVSPNKTDRAQYYNFPVNISLNKSYLQKNDRKIFLMAGMSVQSNIKLREKRLISVVNDLFASQQESLKTIRQDKF